MKTKMTIMLLLSMLFAAHLHAQYTTPGTAVSWTMEDLVNNSSGAITNEGDFYQIHQNITVSATDTVKILQAETIKINQDIEITIEGVLIANSATDNILITAAEQSQTYKTLRFENTNTSVLNNCIIENGNGIELIETNMLIENCIIRNNSDEYNSSAIDLFHSNPTIQHCEIYNNAGPAIGSGATSSSAPLIQFNEIYNNVSSNTNKPQINLGNSDTDTIQIIGNTITGLYEMAGGIAVSTLAGGTLQCIVDSNTIENNRYGFAAIGNDIYSIVRNNTIDNNNIQDDPMAGGSGLNFYGNNSNTAQVFKNTITNNLWGVTVQWEAVPNLGEITGDSTCIGLNKIYDNGNTGTVYDLYNNTPGDLLAENNFWGSYNLDTVEISIFHQTDDSTLGFVDYLPIAEDPTSNIADIKAIDEINAFPNPFNNNFSIDLSKHLSAYDVAELKIHDLRGKLISKQLIKTNCLTKIDASSFENGLYLVQISNQDTYLKKLIMKL